jgi:hypothetical protein
MTCVENNDENMFIRSLIILKWNFIKGKKCRFKHIRGEDNVYFSIKVEERIYFKVRERE